MSQFLKAGVAIGFLIVVFGFSGSTTETRYKCMIQMTNYTGEGAYVTVSLIKPDGSYEKTLRVMGKESKWYPDMIHWWGFQKKKKQSLDGITGASIAGGDRTIGILSIDVNKLDKGYKIRFESAVEAQVYHKKDVEFEFSSANLNQKIEGKGYIRYIRFMPA